MKYYTVYQESLIYQYYTDSANIGVNYIFGSDDLEQQPNYPHRTIFKAYSGVGKAPWPFLMSSAILGQFIINTNVKNTLEKYNLLSHSYHRMIIDFRERHYEYWLLVFNRKPLISYD